MASRNAPIKDAVVGLRIPADEVKNFQKCPQKDFQADFNPGGMVMYKARRPLFISYGSALQPTQTAQVVSARTRLPHVTE